MTTVQGKRVILKSKQGEYLIPFIDDGNNLANIHLSNLSTIGENRLHALKGYLDEGEVISDSKLYEDVHYYAHSTFDITKFSVNGNLTISDNGLVSGFAYTENDKNYIKEVPFNIANKSWRIEFSYKIDGTIPESGPNANPYMIWSTSSGKFQVQISSTNLIVSSNGVLYNIGFGSHLAIGDIVDFTFEYNKTEGKSHLIVYINGVYKNSLTKNSTAITSNLSLSIGCRPELNTPVPSMCSVDLKRFSIRINGEPVLLGSETGEDSFSINNNEVSIPFIKSKTGSKIVDVFYKDRVEAVYEANGSALYYTLDEYNQVITLPMGELYGLISTYGGKDRVNQRNVGEVAISTIPLIDAGLHLLDGGKIYKDGVYDEFVDYIENIYDPSLDCFMNSDAIKIIGNLVNNNGILSGFSTNNYAIIIDRDYLFAPKNNTWEMVFKIKTGSNVTTSQFICSSNFIPDSVYGTVDIYITGSKFKLWVGEGNNKGNLGTGTYTVLTNKDYWVKVVFNGSSYILSYSLTGETRSYINDITINSSVPISEPSHLLLGIDYGGSYEGPFLGTIDINNSYIKIGSDIWWSGNITAEDKWQFYVNYYGICGKFIYDAINHTVRLPKWGMQIFTDSNISIKNGLPVIGNGISIGLTDGTNYSALGSGTDGNAIARSNYGNSVGTAVSSSHSCVGTLGLTTDGTKSGIVANVSLLTNDYGVNCYYYIVVANSTKTEIEVDIDNIMVDLNNKIDKTDIWYDITTYTLYIGVPRS